MSSQLNNSLSEYEVWFLTGSQNLYGEETLRQVAEQSAEVAKTLQESSETSRPCCLQGRAEGFRVHPPCRH